jgi:hypothetical protein
MQVIVVGALGVVVLAGAGCQSTSGSDGAALCGSSACPAALICEHQGGPVCADPTWAQWPMPNAQVDVDAGAPNLESYTDNGDGTLTDNLTGLAWQQVAAPSPYTQPAALGYCADLSLAGHTDWRLPSVTELLSIVDTSTSNPSIDRMFLPQTLSDYYFWSSTPYAGPSGSAWGVYFNNGYSDYNFVTIVYSVRCVR